MDFISAPLYACLFAFTAYAYGYKRIKCLQNARFHMIMFVLLELTFLFFLMNFLSNGVTCHLELMKNYGTGLDVANNMSGVTSFIALSLGNFVHFVFVLKSWIVSKKVEHNNAQTYDPNFELKTKALFIFLILLCVSGAALGIYAFQGNEAENKVLL